MKKTLKGKSIAYSGTFGERSRRDLESELEALGGHASNKINTKTALFIAGSRASGSKLEKARMSGVPILDLEQLEALLGGASIKDVLAMEEVEEVEVKEFGDALADVRDILSGDQSRQSWYKLCELLDRTSEDDIDVLLDYAMPHTESWNDERFFSYWWGYSSTGDVREAPQDWIEQMLTGRDSKKMQIVRVLNLNSKKLVGKVAAKLFEVTHLDNLQALDVGNNKLPVAFFKQLAESGMWSTLRFLSLARIPLRASSVKALASATHLSQLTHLNLEDTKLDDEGLKVLMQLPHLNQLTHLHLGRNSLTSEGIQALTDSPHMANLRYLYLDQAGEIGDEALRALANSPHMAQLEVLDMSHTGLGRMVGEYLGQAEHFDSLRSLNLYFNELDDASMQGLAGSKSLGKLEELDLKFNKIGDQGTKALTEASFASNLTKLDLYDNVMGDEGVLEIANAKHMSALEELNVYCDDLTEVGVVALLNAKQWKLKRLVIARRFPPKSNVAKALKKAKHLSKELRKSLDELIYDPDA